MFSLTHVYILLWHLPLMQPARSAVKTATSILVKPLPITQGTVWKGMRACKTLRGVFQGREFWRSSLRGYDQQFTCELDLGNLRLLCPRNVCPPFSLARGISRMGPWQSKMLLRLSGVSMWPNPVKSSIWTFQILVGTEICSSFCL